MFRRAAIACTVLGLSVLPAHAAPQPSAFAAYKAICYDTRADPKKALAAMGPGWVDTPGPPSNATTTQSLRAKVVGADRWQVLLIEQAIAKGADDAGFAKRVDICMLTTTARASGLKDKVSALMAAPPNAQKNGGVAWSYFDGTAGREYYASGTTEETNARLAKAPLVMVVANETSQGDAAAFTVVRAEP